MSAILRFANVAKRSGAAEVYAVARRELEARDLGRLLLHLRRIEPDWRLQPKERRRLAVELLEVGVPDSTVIEQTEVSRTTVWRIRRDLVQQPEPARQTRIGERRSVSNRATLTRRSSGPILHAEATSANSDFGAMARLLGGSS